MDIYVVLFRYRITLEIHRSQTIPFTVEETTVHQTTSAAAVFKFTLLVTPRQSELLQKDRLETGDRATVIIYIVICHPGIYLFQLSTHVDVRMTK